MASKNSSIEIEGNNLTGRGVSGNDAAINSGLERENAEKAFEETEMTGKTDRRCLRCGGKFLFYESGNSYKIWCENEDYQMTARGI